MRGAIIEEVCETVKGRFATHFVGSVFKANKNPISSRDELAETCQFGTLKEELTRGCMVVGIRRVTLSQKLMQDDTLTVDKAMKQAKSDHVYY